MRNAAITAMMMLPAAAVTNLVFTSAPAADETAFTITGENACPRLMIADKNATENVSVLGVLISDTWKFAVDAKMQNPTPAMNAPIQMTGTLVPLKTINNPAAPNMYAAAIDFL